MTAYDSTVVYDSTVIYDGGAVVDRTPSLNLRLEVAFATGPEDPSPAFVDLTRRLHLRSGVSIGRGRGNEFDTIQPGRMTCAIENIDGALSPDNVSSPFYPNVLPQRRIRLTYRDPGTLGQFNLLSEENASFEGGTIGDWTNTGGVTVSNSATHADVGTKALLVTWPTAASGAAAPNLNISGLVIGRTYTARARVWVPAGVADMRLRISGLVSGAPTSTKNAFAAITVTFTATLNFHALRVVVDASTTAGQQTWVDAVMLDEGSTLGTFTTSPAGPVIEPVFDGHVDRWPIEWPGGGETYSRATITASDLLARIDARQKLRSVVVETMAQDGPVVHLPLAEPDGSTAVSDVVSATPATLPVVQVGSGGALTFASGTGVPTDGLSAPVFAPASSTNGLVLAGPLMPLNYGPSDVTMSVSVNTTGVSSTVCAISDSWGSQLSIEIGATGKIVARMKIPIIGSDVSCDSGIAFNDGQTHDAAAKLSTSGGVTTLQVVVDGTVTNSAIAGGFVLFTRASIGGLPTGSLFTGTLSHFAVFGSALSVGRLLEHRLAKMTGFAGERSDQRIARICTWIGLPATRQALDVGNSTSVGHLDCTGLSPLEYMRRIETTEAGRLFASVDGKLTFHNRARSYSTAGPALSVPVDMVQPSAGLAQDLQLVKNDITGSRPGGATVRQFDQASVDAFGPLNDDMTVVTTSDDDLANAVAWRLNTSKTPLTRFTSLDLDAYTDAVYSPQILAGVDIGARVEITGMPLQAPSSTMRQVVEGYTATISDDQWSLEVNAAPYEHLTGLLLDSALYGTTDSTNHIVY